MGVPGPTRRADPHEVAEATLVGMPHLTPESFGPLPISEPAMHLRWHRHLGVSLYFWESLSLCMPFLVPTWWNSLLLHMFYHKGFSANVPVSTVLLSVCLSW